MATVQDRAEDSRTESEQTEGADTPVAHDVHRAFTPGPWYPGHLGSDGRCQCRSILDGEHMGGIATVHVHNGIDAISEGGNDAPSREQAIANMHLIAAAPEMLEALEAQEELYAKGVKNLKAYKVFRVHELRRAVIAKALGGSGE